MKRILSFALVTAVALTALASTFTIYSTISPTGPSPGPCGITYVGYAIYVKPAPAWGWKIDTSTGTHTASIATNAIVEYVTNFGKHGCGTGSVNVTGVGATEKVRFAVYWPSTLGTPPTGSYPLTLDGFLP
jgi:hypothetical protein